MHPRSTGVGYGAHLGSAPWRTARISALYRNESADLDDCGVHVVGCLWVGRQRVAQGVVGAVLPEGDDPLVQQFLQFGHGPDRGGVGVAAASLDARAYETGQELGELAADGLQGSFNHRLVGRGIGVCRLQVDARRAAG